MPRPTCAFVTPCGLLLLLIWLLAVESFSAYVVPLGTFKLDISAIQATPFILL
nr:MAG TPA: hypothetical protein [Caudoviricetes sp.]